MTTKVKNMVADDGPLRQRNLDTNGPLGYHTDRAHSLGKPSGELTDTENADEVETAR